MERQVHPTVSQNMEEGYDENEVRFPRYNEGQSIDLLKLAHTIFANACSSPATHPPDEWNEYIIETHCVGFLVIGKFEQNGSFTIKSYTTEPC